MIQKLKSIKPQDKERGDTTSTTRHWMPNIENDIVQHGWGAMRYQTYMIITLHTEL